MERSITQDVYAWQTICVIILCIEKRQDLTGVKKALVKGWYKHLEGQFGRWWRPVGLPFNFVSVDLVDQPPDIERGVVARESADARRQEQDGNGGEEQLRMPQRGRAGAGPCEFWLDLDHGQLDLLDLDDSGA